MQYEGKKLNFSFDFPEIKNLDWSDDVYKLVQKTIQPKYHDNCPVGWRTTTIDDVVRFLPELFDLELDLAWRKFRTADIHLMDWYPSLQRLPDDHDKYLKIFPIFNFQEPGMYSVLGYRGDLPPEPSPEVFQPDVMKLALQKAQSDNDEEACDLETKRSAIPINPRDPCMGVPPPPYKPRPKPPEPICCKMMTPPPPPPPPLPSPPPPEEPPPPPIEPGDDPCKQYENIPDVSLMTDEDWSILDVIGEHGYKPRPWCRLPTLNFLPTGVDTIIAGEKGYLVVDGGWQPRDKIEGEYDLPMQGWWDQDVYPPQTITCVCNPLLRRFEYVHPFPDKQLNNKMAQMEVLPDPEKEDGSNMYNIYFVGYNILPETNEFGEDKEELPNPEAIPCRDEVIVAIYNSNVKNWIGTYSRLYVRHLPTNQTNDLAYVEKKLFWISEWADHGRKIKVQNDAFEPPELKWIPVISCFDFESREITGYAFCQEYYHKKIENCLLVECNQNLYIVSRATNKNTKVPRGRFEVRHAEYEKGNPKLSFKKIGTMPKRQYNYLFQNCFMCIDHVDEPTYQCRGGLSVICFYVPHCGTGVLFDVNKCTWVSMDRHCGWDLGSKAKQYPPDLSKNVLASCIWEPDFKAMWSKEYRGPNWDPLGDDPTGPDKWNEPVTE
ncbi:hypothetical protein KC19_5G059300 [Ceratodon purpureus]|uniref:Uncharacterized protein n=1 Tax=Ceratodon purpureus TaxID=3225 RepID=A0A8T0HZT7_CERPU|nr:hypothetical protein KC19_5G059300 [Ceratodon purpureus]